MKRKMPEILQGIKNFQRGYKYADSGEPKRFCNWKKSVARMEGAALFSFLKLIVQHYENESNGRAS